MTARPIYLDNHATTRVDERVLAAMTPYFLEEYGNPGSVGHLFGEAAREAVEKARESIAAGLGAEASEIVFTSGATESNNLAIRGILGQRRRRGDHVISVTTEHKAVLDPLAKLGRSGFEVTLLSPQQQGAANAGQIDPQQVADALRDDTALVSIMAANNEIGVLHPIAEIGRICQERGVPFHCDATQAVGKTPLDFHALGVDLASFTAHKIYGPKGCGALYVRKRGKRIRLEPQIDGGGQEKGVRSGTLNVPGIIGLAAALRLCLDEMATEMPRQAQLRDQLLAGLQSAIDGVTLNGPECTPQLRLAGNLNVSFAGVDGEALMMNVREIAVSSGSACTSANPEPSHVLQAIGLSEDATRSSLRFGLGRFTTAEHIEFAVTHVAAAVSRLRKLVKPT
ncbi:cysteine desulfurase [Blastopirellula sp. JC732]|uniref:cysteine desulfurase n=1 Tax=Blastopirellula sediminis TaxID=2894196 RepID=A0A9X1ML37_9BACT|nr:cysteine desulfurase family protein [Blastopirellula sediminis]MCC9609023.1 cysteine desulfurase [Blastopirellula sediminis]MCC9628200.1 cysteine desulfurase [Blastopirellula sediminis]